MAITSVNRLSKGSSQLKFGAVRYTEVYRVFSDDPAELSSTVQAAAGLPDIGDVYGGDAGAYCTSIDPSQQEDSREHWLVTCTWETPNFEQSEQPEDPDDRVFPPQDRPQKMRWSSKRLEIALQTDKDGNPIVNSAGDPFDPPLVDDRYITQLTVVKNYASYSGVTGTSYQGKVNSATVEFGGITAAVGTVLCESIEAEEMFESDSGTEYNFWQLTMVFLYDPLGWKKKPIDAGFREIASNQQGDLVLKHITIDAGEDEEGNPVKIPVASPVPLDGNGKALSQADMDAGNHTILSFDTKDTANLNSIGIDFE